MYPSSRFHLKGQHAAKNTVDLVYRVTVVPYGWLEFKFAGDEAMNSVLVVKLTLSIAPLAPIGLMTYLCVTAQRDRSDQYGMLMLCIAFYVVAVAMSWGLL